MINLCAFRRDDNPIRLNCQFSLDLTWRSEFFQSWNGCSFLHYLQGAPLPGFKVSFDTSGTLGYGALFQCHWFLGSWLPTQLSQSIEYQELFPIIVVAYISGPLWASKRVNFLSDNSSVVEIPWSGTSRAPTIMALGLTVHYLCLLAARHSSPFLPPQLVESVTPLLTHCCPFSDSASDS